MRHVPSIPPSKAAFLNLAPTGRPERGRRVNNTAFTVLDADAQDVAARLQEISPKASPCSAQLRQKQNGCGGFSAGMLRITTMRASCLGTGSCARFPSEPCWEQGQPAIRGVSAISSAILHSEE